MTPEERERLRRIMLARTGPLSSGVSPGGFAPWNQMPISDEAWYTLPPSLTGGMLSAEDYRSAVDQNAALRDKRVLDYLSSGRLPTQADTTTPPVQTDTRERLSGRYGLDESATRDAAIDPVIPSIPSGGGLSAAALERLRTRQNKWGGYMDAHAFATGATSRRKSFDAGLKSMFGTTKDDKFQKVESGNSVYTFHQNPRTGEWSIIATAPRWQEKDPQFTKGIDGRNYWVTGPKAGQLVLDKDLKKEHDPTEDMKEYEFAENLLRAATLARKEKGTDSAEYKNAMGAYNRFIARSTTEKSTTADIQEYEYLNRLYAEAETIKGIKGENSSEYLAAKEDARRFATQIATGTGGTKDEVRMFYRTAPAVGEEQQVVGFIDYTGDRPVFRDMNGNVLTGVVPIPKAEMTITQEQFVESLTPVKTEIGEAAVAELDTTIELSNYTRLLKDLEQYGRGASGLRGILTEKIGGSLGQISPYLEEGFAQFIGGITADQAADFKNRLRMAVIDLIPVYTREESKRITKEERELTEENSRLTVPTASVTQIQRALKNALELRLISQMRHRLIVSGEPKYDLTTDKGINRLGNLLKKAGYTRQQRVTLVTRLMGVQKELQDTFLAKQAITK